MKLSFNWLNDYVKVVFSVEKLAERLTMAGHEVKAIENAHGDSVFEIEVTPNRPDCLNVVGLARETAAILNRKLKTPQKPGISLPKKMCDITIEDPQDCRRYIGAVVQGVCVGPLSDESGTQMGARLVATGLRLINNVVDITNFCLFESGQPMHAFDYDKLIGGKIIVRRARKGEKIVTIDGVNRELDPSILVIADEKRPVAIAGIMGGLETQVTAGTQRIFLESAWFDPVLVRRAGRRLGLASDSSYRFERGVVLSRVDECAKRALSLILRHAGGQVTEYSDLYLKKGSSQKAFSVNAHDVRDFLGSPDLSLAQIKAILSRLEFHVKEQRAGRLVIRAPDFRNDVNSQADVAEEVSRIIGYDRMPTSLPQIKPSTIASSPRFLLKRRLRGLMVGLGFSECITYPMTSLKDLKRTLQDGLPCVQVKNPLSLDQEMMRPSLLPGFLTVAARNLNHGQKSFRFVEFGKIYPPSGEREVLGLLLCGERRRDWRDNTKTELDFYDLKGALQAIVSFLSIPSVKFSAVSINIFNSGNTADLLVNDQKIGHFGAVHRDILRQWDIRNEELYFAEIDLELLLDRASMIKRFRALPVFPSIQRDVSLAVSKDVPFEKFKDTAFRLGQGQVIEVRFVEQYLGDKIPLGHKGLVFSLVYQSIEKTLTDQEVSPIHENILHAYAQDLGATIR